MYLRVKFYNHQQGRRIKVSKLMYPMYNMYNSTTHGGVWKLMEMCSLQYHSQYLARPSTGYVHMYVCSQIGMDCKVFRTRIKPRTVATLALTARRSNHLARSYPQLGQILSTQKTCLLCYGLARFFLPIDIQNVYHRERILETSTLSCNEEEEEITKPPKR